ncbi:MAG: rRNA pseudouridine synthase [Lawsonibacter sp.]|nr:rRNA pseudouridine synthase [Lawsonibacter sp.]
MAQQRLDKLLAGTGRWSRREVKDLIRQGRVAVDGLRAGRPEDKCDPALSVLTVDGEEADCAPFVYLMLHKPAGLLSATEDRSQKTVLDLLPEPLRRRGLFPVGRLDKDTEGLLLLTDDGPLAHGLLSPRKHVDKVYFARVDGLLTREDVRALGEGMTLGDGLRCLPADLEALGDGSECRLTLREGKYHQAKRMLAARGKPVLYLKRLSMGPLMLDEALERGAWRPLKPEELRALRQETGA